MVKTHTAAHFSGCCAKQLSYRVGELIQLSKASRALVRASHQKLKILCYDLRIESKLGDFYEEMESLSM